MNHSTPFRFRRGLALAALATAGALSAWAATDKPGALRAVRPVSPRPVAKASRTAPARTQAPAPVKSSPQKVLAPVNVSGTVRDGSGANWPLWARVTVTGGGLGSPVVVYTNPANGQYAINGQLDSTQTYTFNVEALIPGYNAAARSVISPPGTPEDFNLLVNGGTCEALGYQVSSTTLLNEGFNSGIPGTWTVTNTGTVCNSGIGQWNTDPGQVDATTTIGTDPRAVINSDSCGSGADVITDLETPTFNLTALSGSDAVSIAFDSDYRDLCTVANTDAVSLDIWNGTSWVTVFDYCTVTTKRNVAEVFGTQAANGASDAKFRFHYDGGWDWWWVVDNVQISQTSCTYQGGGLVWGFVRDAVDDSPLVGAEVDIDTPAGSTATAASPDPGQPDGIYFLYGNAGSRTLNASAANYSAETANASVVAGNVVRQDFELASGHLELNPNPVNARFNIGATGTINATLANTGGLDSEFTIYEINSPNPSLALTGPLQSATPRVSNDDKLLTFATSARNHPRRTNFPPNFSPQIPPRGAGGDVIDGFDAGLPGGPYGLAVRQPQTLPPSPVEVWLGNLAALAGNDENHQYNSNGLSFLTPTGTVVSNPAGAVFWADMAYNSRTDTFWQVNVGGDNCIHEFISTGFTGKTICPAFQTSQRGLAYDPRTDTYYSGSFNDGIIVQFNTDGTILREVFKDVDTVGLAFNPVSGRLYALQNTASPESDIVVMDANTPDLDFINAFDIVHNNISVMGDFEQAGLDLDCNGRLWSDNFVTGRTYVSNSGETKTCLDIPWLTVDPSEGAVAPNSSIPIALNFDGTQATPGFHQAHILIANDTPSGPIEVPVNYTAAFLDVPSSDFFERFIHSLAGAGITAGCGAGNFCPNDIATRRIVPVWLLLGKYGASYRPPAATGTLFADVPAESFGVEFIEQFYNLGITTGCSVSPRNYCPSQPVTRIQTAIFLLRLLEGPNYVPPPATGIFADVPVSNPFAPFVEEFFNRGITSGCATNPLRFCPNGMLTRGQLATFVVRTYGLPIAAP